MDKELLKTARFFGSATGGDITCSDKDGVVKWSLGVIGQIVKGVDLLAYVEPGDIIELSGGVTAMIGTGNRLSRMRSAHAFDSGANPDFQPAAVSQSELMARKLLKEVQAQSKSLDQRMKSFDEAQKAAKPVRPAPDPDPVVEDPTPEPAEDPKKGKTVEQVEASE